jgi:hypothetical protein
MNTKNNKDFRKLVEQLADFREGATEAKSFNKVTKLIIKEQNEKLIDEIDAKRNENWSVLANQVVGSENFGG